MAALIYPTLSERNERKLILLILSELSESSFRSGTRDVVLPDWLVYKERLGRDAVSTADRNTWAHYCSVIHELTTYSWWVFFLDGL